jgi:hypothetical protein
LRLLSSHPVPGLDPLAEVAPSWTPEVCLSWQDDTGAAGVTSPVEPWYVSPDCDDDGAPLLIVVRGPGGGCFTMHYSEGADFIVAADGSHVSATWRAPLTIDDAATYLLGPVLGFVMRLRGVVPMHASAVVVDGHGLLFVGPEGAGKSTTAAAFARIGAPVLSDDIVPLVSADGATIVLPGHPRVSLWPDVVEGLFGSTEALPAVSAVYPKRYLQLRDEWRFQAEPVPLGGICVLRPRRAALRVPEVRALTAREALMELVANTYCGYLLDAPMRAQEFAFLGAVAERVPVWSVRFSASIAGLEDLCRSLALRAGLAA